MKFASKEHQKFWLEKFDEMIQLGKIDVYYKSIIYTLGICETTRKNFDDIFSLWNGCNFDREQDIENKNLSANYNVSEIFSCSYAPYFYEAIRIRYPEYTREISKGITKENNFGREAR